MNKKQKSNQNSKTVSPSQCGGSISKDERDGMQDERRTVLGLIAESFFIVLPILLVGLAFEKTYTTLQAVVHPVLDTFPSVVFRNPVIRELAVVVVIMVLLLLIGLVAHTRMGRAIGRWLEAGFLKHLPFYTMLRNLSSGLAGKEGEHSFRTVMVTMNPGQQQMGLLVERHSDGSGTVFLPSSPNPGSGTVVVVEAALMRELPVPSHRLLQCLSSWGDGTAAMLEMAHNHGEHK
jgi:uncharacterized membrane protein